jgi:hypothetical protein
LRSCRHAKSYFCPTYCGKLYHAMRQFWAFYA